MTRAITISAQGRSVLQALAAAEAFEYGEHNDGTPAIWPAGLLRVWALVDHVQRPGASLNVTRASLSRTLRRLWRDGFVELSDGWRSTMTKEQETVAAAVARHEADPVAAYERYKALMGEGWDRHGSVQAFMAAQRSRRPSLRVTHVQITDAGRARLTVSAPTNETDDSTREAVNCVVGRS